jgi:hypothetical protein
MSKTAEELAEEYGDRINDTHSVKAACEKAFIAGYKAAKDQQEKEYGALVSKSKAAMQALNDQLADVSKVIDPIEKLIDDKFWGQPKPSIKL